MLYAALGLAVGSAIALHQPLKVALHPPPDSLSLADDAELTIISPEDGATVEAGTVTVEIAVTGGSIGPGGVPVDDLGTDPEEAGALAATVDGEPVDVQSEQTCTVEEPCRQVSFPLELPPGQTRLHLELLRGDGMPFAPTITDIANVEAQ